MDLVLGDGMRERGALCDRIPQAMPGVGYVVLDGDPTPVRVRFSYLTDTHIRDMAARYGRLRVIDGEYRDNNHSNDNTGSDSNDSDSSGGEQGWRRAA